MIHNKSPISQARLHPSGPGEQCMTTAMDGAQSHLNSGGGGGTGGQTGIVAF